MTKGHREVFDATRGLPRGVNKILQDKEGNLWLATAGSGVVKYDGRQWTAFTTKDGLSHDNVYSILQDSSENLWCGTRSGLSKYDGEKWTAFQPQDGLGTGEIWSLVEDSKGNLWISTWEGVSIFNRKQFVQWTSRDGPVLERGEGLPDDTIWALLLDSQGNIWIGGDGGVSKYDGNGFTHFTQEDGLIANGVWALGEDRRGNIWIGTRHGLNLYDGRALINFTQKEGLAQNWIRAIFEDAEGNLWIGAWGDGVSKFDGENVETFTVEDGLLDNHVRHIYQDREGSIWFANMGGLSRLDEKSVQILTTAPVHQILIKDRQNNLWFDSESLLCRYDGDSVEIIHTFAQPVYRILRVERSEIPRIGDSQNKLWVGTWGGKAGIFDGNRFSLFTTEEGFPTRGMLPLLEDKDGNLWFSTNRGILRYDGEQFCTFTVVSFLRNKRATCALQTKNGDIWFGTWQGGLSRYDGEHFYAYTEKDGIQSNKVPCLLEDKQGNIWFGTDRGLTKYDGKTFEHFGSEAGLLNTYIQCSFQDGQGNLWFGTMGGGALKFDGHNFQSLTTEDGLPSNCVTGIQEDDSGAMIFATFRGIARYTIGKFVPPAVSIKRVMADKIYADCEEIELSTTAADLIKIEYHGKSFKTKRMRYNYILECYDKTWRKTWEEEAIYENLPVGKYTFKVVAINRDLVSSGEPAQLKIRVVPDVRNEMVEKLQRQVHLLIRQAQGKYQFPNIIGESEKMQHVSALMTYAIETDIPVLITGETGTGKELIAKAIHYNSKRKDRPFLPVNCASFTETILESELFGHKKGAFTGATSDRMGIFAAADSGSVFLDEIGDTSELLQAKLLRVLQEGEIRQVGETTPRKVDVRIFSATNKEIASEVESGSFRRDLYYRLNAFTIALPPLRERKKDIPLLAEHFLKEAIKNSGKTIRGFTKEAMDALFAYDWPGNVRELKNEIERAVALAGSEPFIDWTYLSPHLVEIKMPVVSTSTGKSWREIMADFQRQIVTTALRECESNKTRAAQKLGMTQPNLLRLMKRLGISNEMIPQS